MSGASDSARAFDEWLIVGSRHYSEWPQLHILLHLQHPLDSVSIESAHFLSLILEQSTWCNPVPMLDAGSMLRVCSSKVVT